MNLIAIALLGVGCQDGTAPVRGTVQIDGQPAPAGQLILAPLGGGPRALSRVDESGGFDLRSSDGGDGAYPGRYQATFQHPLSDEEKKKIATAARGALDPNEFGVLYRSRRDSPVTLPESGEKNLVINITPNEGWERVVTH